MMKKIIAVACGGYSQEYEISLQSGQMIFDHIDHNIFTPYKVHILKNEWFVLDKNENKHPIDRADFSVKINGKKIHFDAVYNSIHGSPGEDGVFQAYLELLNIPQTASEHYPAALTFNKRDCINVLKTHGINSAPNYVLNQGDQIDEDEIVKKVGLPCFVKANRAGSSFGITKVSKKKQLKKAIAHSYEFDPEIIIESALAGTEVSVSVINSNDKLRVLPITQIISENEFFDYDAKYHGKSKEITPAPISEEATRKLEKTEEKIVRVLKLKGLSRAEFIFQDGEPYFIETNTVPGTSPASIVPQQIRAAGLTFKEVVTGIIEHAIEMNQTK